MFKETNFTMLILYCAIFIVGLSLISLLSILPRLFNQLDMLETEWKSQFQEYTVKQSLIQKNTFTKIKGRK